MLSSLLELDLELFYAINGLNTPWLDQIMFLVSSKWIWIPAYIFILARLYILFGIRKTLLILLGVGVLITCTDRTTSGLLKPNVKRYRPCKVEAGLDQPVHTVNNKCGGNYGFASSHAANFWGLATFLAFIFRKKIWTWPLFFFAALVSYSRIYLGVHYPGDVIAGAFIGLFFGAVIYLFGRKLWEPDR